MDTSTRPDFQPRQRQRFLAPDLARGVMLSMTALANVIICTIAPTVFDST
ncbi:MAG TPA: hypothetical protein VK053_19225 [Jiangellaceae bacterium]|nr:hypothetical protein [Jiangellaceae bacterium]